ncbi:MAG TPA: ABC transporter ATP-binding protein [Bacteroidales bacterium]|nr:ABC transporter ATP-binding protein [Bacteroidales bacterium]HPF03524.1 ABC transporter ATP-binding protein [Bacteroidales bacterium]HPJ58619.1 ABC transporter ATP-binding protein [Bacteroidales bacterium]HPR11222.1 ABC transporter ATP-binding protein [Bacteroidales bacterium]HRW85494.1 ABC transporter ATP-binding protein [Bacteroidales bacterium]
MRTEKDIILSFESLEIGYGSGRHRRVLLPPLSASAHRGELVAVIGRNGIGKSTLLRTIIGIQPALGGSVKIDGDDLSSIPRIEIARKIGYISTESIRVSNMTVYDLIALGRYPYKGWLGGTDANGREAVENALARTGMAELAYRYIAELSDGELQRAMIGRVLAQDTAILVMDEPTAYLDVMSKHEMVNLMQGLTDEGKTIIFSTHDFSIATGQAHRIWLTLDDKLAEGAPEDLIINRSFESLFDSPSVGFDSDAGTFFFRNKAGKEISLKGEGMIRKWTEKALVRAGFVISGRRMTPCITAPDEPTGEWILEKDSDTKRFRSVYDLLRSLCDERK